MFGKKKQLSAGAVSALPKAKRTRDVSSWFLLGSLVFAVAAAFAVVAFLRAAVPSVQVFVVKSDLRPGDVITAAALEKKSLPSVAVPKDAVKRQEDVVNRHARSYVAAGDVLRAAHVSELAGSPVAVGLSLAGDPNLRAVALPKEASQGLKVEPGDRVDVYAFIPVQGAPADRGFAVASGAMVISAPEKNRDTGQESGVTLAVPQEAAARIAAVLGMNGKLLVVAVPAGLR